MKLDDLKQKIDVLFENIANISSFSKENKTLIEQVLNMLDSGKIKVAEKLEGNWILNDYIKKAILIYMKVSKASTMNTAFDKYLNPDATSIYYHSKVAANMVIKTPNTCGMHYYDKVPLKFAFFTEDDFKMLEARIVPGAIVRYGSYIAKRCVIMPSFINIGAYVGEGTMIDTWATVGSCAQVGKNCHISGGAGIGGVLEPASNMPVIIEDNVFIGARSEIAEGVIVEEGSVISMGVYIGASTKIIDRETGEVFYGRVPAGSVVVAGSTPSKNGVNLYAAIIVKKVDATTRSKTSLNDLLRD